MSFIGTPIGCGGCPPGRRTNDLRPRPGVPGRRKNDSPTSQGSLSLRRKNKRPGVMPGLCGINAGCGGWI